MYVFGHAGLTIAAARRFDKDVDPRLAGLLALGPDIVDKPLSRLFPEFVHHNTRSLGHTALFSFAILIGALLWNRKPKTALVLGACFAGHLLLDGMWRNDNPVILLWPLLGPFPYPQWGPVFSGLTAFNVAGEIAGLVLLVRLFGLRDRRSVLRFLKTGKAA